LSKPFRSDKRKKELQRLKKQEEKRLRRFGLKQEGDTTIEGEVADGENEITETGQDEPESGHPENISEDGQPETKQEIEQEI
jgi:hypothetical protein